MRRRRNSSGMWRVETRRPAAAAAAAAVALALSAAATDAVCNVPAAFGSGPNGVWGERGTDDGFVGRTLLPPDFCSAAACALAANCALKKSAAAAADFCNRLTATVGCGAAEVEDADADDASSGEAANSDRSARALTWRK